MAAARTPSKAGAGRHDTRRRGSKQHVVPDSSVVCGTCLVRCALTCRVCPVCEAAPQLRIGGYSFHGAKKTLFETAEGPVLANSCVFLGRACGPKPAVRGIARTPSGAVDERPMADVADELPQESDIAMKTVPINCDVVKEDMEMARREIQFFKSMKGSTEQHPNLLPLLAGLETESELVLLSPYASGGDLAALTCVNEYTFRCLEEPDGGALAEQLLNALEALHNMRYLHGDVKPQNIFLIEVDGAFVAQLGDFGLARRVPEGAVGLPRMGGSAGYMAPECVGRTYLASIEECAYDTSVSFPADLFALGVVLYQLLSSMSPFDPPSNVLAELEFDEACWEPLAPSAQAFVTRLLEKAPDDRGTAVGALGHEWLTQDAPKAERGVKRALYAPRPAEGVRFHRGKHVTELWRSGRMSTMKSPGG
eukprot:TRINITY_DN16829_c0_g1_i2.p1 TRINITY_DN16829_c0_g1~~TRINITY_DN16829_c0_g1_i2.p1  ORF type:complete len:423 (+),score=71.86 TRINITY_DN16829_c0_g1_i2:81-1349(+)